MTEILKFISHLHVRMKNIWKLTVSKNNTYSEIKQLEATIGALAVIATVSLLPLLGFKCVNVVMLQLTFWIRNITI